MKIAAHVLAYNVNRFLPSVLKNLEPHVEKIYVAHSERPWGYVESSRQNLFNPTTITDVINASSSNKIEIVKGDWATEEDMRNDCLKRARADGFDWFIIQDADEFYMDSTWEQIKKILLNNKSDKHFKTTWYNFWKSSQYVLMYPNGSIKHTNASFAIRCSSDVQFLRKRWFGDQIKVIDCPCFHYGFVMSDEEMFEKISTWGHANELFSDLWFKYKWQNWNENTSYLHPILPSNWPKAIRFPFQQPDFAEEFSLNLTPPSIVTMTNSIGDSIYNANVGFFEVKKAVKRIAKSVFHHVNIIQ